MVVDSLSAKRERPSAPRPGALVFAIALLVYLATAGGSLGTTDAVITYEVTENLLRHGSVALSSNVLRLEADRGIDGRYYSPFGIGQSIYNIPFYLAGVAAQRATGLRVGKPDTLPKAAVAFGGAVAAAACVWVTFLFAWRLTGSPSAAAVAAFALAFGSVLWPYSKFGFNAPLVAACLVGGVYAVWIGTRDARPNALLAGGALVGGAFLTRHEMVLALLPLGAWLAWELTTRSRIRDAALAAVGILAAGLLSLWYNFIRFGNPLNNGYLSDPTPGFGSPIASGLYGLLLAPGGSIFLYSPIVLAGVVALRGLARRDQATAWLFGTLAVVFVLFYATLANWAGGRSYGPRYLVPLLPFLCIPLAHVFAYPGAPTPRRTYQTVLRRATLFLLALSVLAQLPGVLVDFAKVSVARAHAIPNRPDPRYSWTEAPIVLNAKTAADAVPRNVRYLVGWEPPPRIEPSSPDRPREFSQQFAFSLDFWWLYLFYLGAIPAPVALALGALPLAGALVLAWHLPGQLRTAERRTPSAGGPGEVA